MKKIIFCAFILFSLLFTSCEPLENFVNNTLETLPTAELSVLGFSKESVVLTWTTEYSNARFNIYVKDKDGKITCVENNYGHSNYFVSSDDKSSYAIGILSNDREVYKTPFKYPSLAENKGFPASIEIADDSCLGVECFYPSNVDLFSIKGTKEDGETYHTNKYPAAELNSFLLPILYEKGSHNNSFNLVFTIGEVEYLSAPYYFDYEHHEQAQKLLDEAENDDANKSITLYPTL